MLFIQMATLGQILGEINAFKKIKATISKFGTTIGIIAVICFGLWQAGGKSIYQDWHERKDQDRDAAITLTYIKDNMATRGHVMDEVGKLRTAIKTLDENQQKTAANIEKAVKLNGRLTPDELIQTFEKLQPIKTRSLMVRDSITSEFKGVDEKPLSYLEPIYIDNISQSAN